MMGIPLKRKAMILRASIVIVSFALLPAAVSVGEQGQQKRGPDREVSTGKQPTRVVSLAPSVTEIIFALEKQDLLQGVTQHCDFPAQAQSLPKIGSYKHPDMERIVSLRPDLCIGIEDGNPKDLPQRLESLNIPVHSVAPTNLEGVMRAVMEIGGLLGAREKAEETTASMRARISRLNAQLKTSEARPGVLFLIGTSPIVSVGPGSLADELIAGAAGRNLAGGAAMYPRFTREEVLALQPDVLIISSMTRGEDFERVKSEWSGWKDLPAARSGRIFVVGSDLFDRPTPRLLDGLELLAKILHPELFQVEK